MVILSQNGYTVHRTRTRRCACYIIETSRVCVLIDTSMPFEKNIIVEDLREIMPKKIDAIFLTHSHSDHVANAKYFSEILGCKVYISSKGLEKMRQGRCTMPKGRNLFARLVCALESVIPFYQFTQFQACPEVAILNDEMVKFYLGESAKLLETPGHSQDSISILIDDTIAFVGDAMVNNFGKLYPPFADDEKDVGISWKKLLDSQCNLYCPAHGKPLNREKLLETYTSVYL